MSCTGCGATPSSAQWPMSTTAGGVGRGRAAPSVPETANPARTVDGCDEDKDDDGAWAVTCLIVRKGYRGRGLTSPSPAPRSTSPTSVAPGHSRPIR
jgi:hypothetical protein